MSSDTTFHSTPLSAATIARFDRELSKYPDDQKQSAVMAALVVAQDHYGWVTPESIEELAQILEMPPIAIQEVATFYNMFNLESKGKYQITVCTNISCMLRNSDEIVQHLEKKLGISFGEVSKDKKFSLKEGECMGACGSAPLCLINNHTMHEYLTTEKIDQLLASLK
ncbi:MAG: NAD(P)H-dependent oxidoreductase subunit E [Burkholderiaceae bacterium]|nr:NAD(P)H-dependent oxidoreductase subunit E [Burkholderiaceae bacterium]